MKKAYSILATLPIAHSALGHSSQVVHIHPHGDNPYLTTWLIAALVGVALGGRYVLKRIRQK